MFTNINSTDHTTHLHTNLKYICTYVCMLDIFSALTVGWITGRASSF